MFTILLIIFDTFPGMVEVKGTLVGSNAGVMSVDFDSTGAYIVGASNDFASRVWTVADQRLRVSLHFTYHHDDRVCIEVSLVY